MTEIVLHPGYPKAASSWLQENLWNDSRTGLCAPWAVPGPWGEPATIAEETFVRVHDADFDAVSARAKFEAGIEAAKEQDLVPVLSSEILLDRPNGLGGWSTAVARRLAETFPGARVVIVVREQNAAILSSYRHHVETGGRESMTDFIGEGGALIPLRISHFQYDLALDLYQSLFGNERVTMVPFELLRAGTREFATAILRASGMDGVPSTHLNRSPSNRGSNAVSLTAQRFFNRVVQPDRHSGRSLGWLGAVKVASDLGRTSPARLVDMRETQLRRRVALVVGDLFSSSNTRLAARTGIDLEGLGYKGRWSS